MKRTYKTYVSVGLSVCFLGVRGSGELKSSLAGTDPVLGDPSAKKGLLGESR